ncbi:MAG: glycosyltransferase family 9 protein [Anaerolineae bacterium]|nr:glycosyltransferase family 9 protein [Gemmatimonadaceae bacterium]
MAAPAVRTSGKTQTEPQEAWQASGDEPREALVVQTSFLGDAVLTTPLIAELAMRGPVDVVLTPASAPLLANNPAIRHLFIYDKRADAAGLMGLWQTSMRLRGRRAAPPAPARRERRATRIAYLAQGSVRSATLALLAGCEERVGFATSPGRLLYTTRVTFRDDRHHAERLWRLGFPSQPGIEPPEGSLQPRLYPSVADTLAVDSLLAGTSDDRPLVALAPGSAWGTKRWPFYADLARRLAPRARIAIIGGAGDTDLGKEIAESARSAVPRKHAAQSVIDATGRLSLLGSADLIGRASALVTNDSSPSHLASAMGTRTITIFGPTVPEFGFGPLARRSKPAGLDGLPCRPCHHHGPDRCPLGHWRCMRDLDAERVEALLTSILD